jgi:starch phosphorylase
VTGLPNDPSNDPSRLQRQLHDLARDLRWFGDLEVRALFTDLLEHPAVIEHPAVAAGHDTTDGDVRHPLDPYGIVTTLPASVLAALAADAAFSARVHDLAAARVAHVAHAPDLHGGARMVAYLSAEFALADPFHSYSGGLGVLAGDHVRSADELGVPLVAIGLAYRDGYFAQRIDADGGQVALPAVNDLTDGRLTAVTDPAGEPVHVTIELAEGVVVACAWRLDVGRVPVLLLDTDLEQNTPELRAITRTLYGGDRETRLRQELVLGVGGVRLLAALGTDVVTYHLNEGHSAFAGLERLSVHRRDGLALPEAIDAVRAELQFTTHTPVPAGHDTFDWDLAEPHLRALSQRAGIGYEGLWDLATGDGFPTWNQTVLALRLSGRTNGVARLHGEVSRRMFTSLWPDRDVADVPIDHVTNGVHPSSWTGPDMAALLDRHVPGWRGGVAPEAWQTLRAVDRRELWAARRRSRARLLAEVTRRADGRAARTGTAPLGQGLDPDTLTIGFARRFATYKRGNLMLRDADRLARLLGATDRPVQIIVAGKAHPADGEGQAVLRELVHAAADPAMSGRLVVVEGYDLTLGGLLTSGCDVWLNTPLRPNEASGTSGMKAAMNGGLNLSVLDGWWDEAVLDQGPHAEVGIGWSIGGRDGDVDVDVHARDAADALDLYRLLEDEVVPTFHDRDADGVPQRWATMMLDATVLLSPVYSSHRMVTDYAQRYALERR